MPAEPGPLLALMPNRLLASRVSLLRPQSDSRIACASVTEAGTPVLRCDSRAPGATDMMKSRCQPAAPGGSGRRSSRDGPAGAGVDAAVGTAVGATGVAAT